MRAPISMKQKPNNFMSKNKKLFNYMCYIKYAPLCVILDQSFKFALI